MTSYGGLGLQLVAFPAIVYYTTDEYEIEDPKCGAYAPAYV
jgi:hypothetical protein